MPIKYRPEKNALAIVDGWSGRRSTELLGDLEMPPFNLKSADTERRLSRIVWRDRVRIALLTAGVAFAGTGGLLALLPFGPPTSNSTVIPNADPDAGLAILQSLPADTARHIRLGLALTGAVLLLCAALANNRESRVEDTKHT